MPSMHRMTIVLAISGIAMLWMASLADAQRPRREIESEPMYALLAIDDDVHILLSTEVRDRIRVERERHAEAVCKYRERRASAREREIAFDEEAPVAPDIDVVVASIRGKKEAEVKRARYLAKRKGWKRGNFAVILIGSEFRIVSKSEVDDLREAIENEYAKMLAAYEREKKSVEQGGGSFDRKPPVEPDVRVAPRTFTTEIEARHYIEAYLERLERARNRGADGERDSNP